MVIRARLPRTIPFSLATLLLLTALFALSACGRDPTTTTQAETAQEGRIINQAAVNEMPLDEFRQTVREAADRLVARHSGDEGGFYALILALDTGYDAYQLLTGSLNDRLESDGRITGSDGSTLTPARQPEGAFGTPGDAASGAGACDATKPILLASLSGPVLLADSVAARERRILFWDGVTTMGEYFGDIRTRYLELEEQAKLDAEMYERITLLTTVLAARGYGVQQILEGILLDQVRVYVDPESEGTICWYIEHTSGTVLRPVHAPLDPFAEMECPAADKNAPAAFDPEAVKTVLVERDLGEHADTGTDAPGGGGDASGGGGSSPGPGNGGAGPSDEDGELGLDLNGDWVGALSITKAFANGVEVSNLQAEGCDYTAIYRVTHSVSAKLVLTPDGKGTISWLGDSVALETGHTQTLEGGTGPLEWTFEDGWLELVVRPEAGGELVIRGQPTVLPEGVISLEGAWAAADTRPLFEGDEDELDFEAEGVFSAEKVVE